MSSRAHLVADASGRRVACVAEQRLSLVDVERRQVREEGLGAEAVGVAFLEGPPASVLVVLAGAAPLLQLRDAQSLAVQSEHPATNGARPVAVAGERVLLLGGGETRVVICQGGRLAEARTMPRTAIERAAPAPYDRVLALAQGHLETWDLATLRPVSRLVIPLKTTPRHFGFCAGGRYLWMTTDEDRRLHAYRISDGRLHYEVDLGAPVAEVSSVVAAPRVVLGLGSSDPSVMEALVEVNLVSRERRVLRLDRVQSFCLAGASLVALDEGNAFVVLPLDGGGGPSAVSASAPPPAHNPNSDGEQQAARDRPPASGANGALAKDVLRQLKELAAKEPPSRPAERHVAAPEPPAAPASSEASLAARWDQWRARVLQQENEHPTTPMSTRGATDSAVQTALERAGAAWRRDHNPAHLRQALQDILAMLQDDAD